MESLRRRPLWSGRLARQIRPFDYWHAPTLGRIGEISSTPGRTSARRFTVADPAHRFHQRFVEPNASAIEMFGPEKVWRELVAPHLNTYMGHEFERIVSQAYSRSATIRSLPLLKEWSRWEGTVKDGGSVEIDIVAPLASGANMLTGSIKWGEAPRPVKDFFEHRRSLDALPRAVRPGRTLP